MALDDDQRERNLDRAVHLAQAGRLTPAGRVTTPDGVPESIVEAAKKFDEHLDNTAE